MSGARASSLLQHAGTLLVPLALISSACDWVHSAFQNSIPIESVQPDGAGLHVYLGLDGLSWATVREAMGRGAFSGSDWRLAKFVTMFPATSDASWTRILRTSKLEGYEFEYYDSASDRLLNSGLGGVARHVLPTVSESLSFEAEYLAAFDYRSNGYTHSLEAYRDTWVSLGETLDSLFFMLEGRMETGSVFTAYLLESDVLGHIGTPEDGVRFVAMLDRRIAAFREAHRDRTIHFTLVSDHGMDFTEIPRNQLVDFRQELPKVSVRPVQSFAECRFEVEVCAIPIVHTRVTYVALHARDDQIPDVGARVSRLESVDFVVAAIEPPSEAALLDDERARAISWYGIWTHGRLGSWFGFDRAARVYVLPAHADLERLGIPVDRGSADRISIQSDEALFDATKDGRYPDLLYRVRTALSTTGVNQPAQLLVSFRTGFGSIGFRLPGGLDVTGGYHGSAEAASTIGVLLTDERDLPGAVRADAFLSLFPRAEEHLRARGLELVEGDEDAARPSP